MSLIADSLKKAVRRKSNPEAPSQVPETGKLEPQIFRASGNKSTLRGITIIVFLLAVLGFLIYAGALDPSRQSITQLPLLEKNTQPVETLIPVEMPPAGDSEETEEFPVKASTKEPDRESVRAIPTLEKKTPVPVLSKKHLIPKKPSIKNTIVDDTEQDFIGMDSTDDEFSDFEDAMAGINDLESGADDIVVDPVPVKEKPIARKEEKNRSVRVHSEPEMEEPLQKVASLSSAPPPPSRVQPPPLRELEKKVPESKSLGDIFQDSNYFFNRGVFFQEAGDLEKSLINFRKAAELDPSNPDVFNNMGVIYKELNMFDQATEDLLRALYLNPRYVKAYNNIGVVYYLKGNYNGAVANYQKAIELDPENLESYNNLSVIYKKLNQLEQAKAILNKALAKSPKDAATNYNLAVLYEELGDRVNALNFYRRFLQFGMISHPVLGSQVEEHLKSLQ